MFGAFMDAAMNIPKMMHAEEMQNDQQGHAFASQLQAQQFSSAQSATQHQRAVADLRAAGLNPILSARQGNAAASSSAAGAGGGAAQLQSSFTQGQLNDAQTALMEGQGKLLKEQARSEHEHIYQRYWQTAVEEQRLQTEKHLTERAKHEASIASNSAKGAELEGNIDETKYGAIMRYINRAIRAITGGSSAYRNIQP